MGAGGGYQQPMGKGGGYQQPMSYGQPYGGGKGGQRLPQQGPPNVTDGQYRPYTPNSGQSPYGPFGGPIPRAGMFDGRRERPEFQPVAEPAFPRFPSAYDRDPASNSNIGVPAFRDIPEYRALQDARQRQREEMQNLQNAFRQTGQYQDYMRELPPMRPQKTPFNQDPRGMPSFNPVELEALGIRPTMPPRRGGSFVEMYGPASQNPLQRVPRDPQPIAAPVKGGIQPAVLQTQTGGPKLDPRLMSMLGG